MSDNEEDDRPDQLFGGARPSTAPATRTLAEPAAPAEPVPVPPTEAMAAASLRPSTAAASSEAALPPPPPPSAATGGDEPISGASVSACPSFEALRSALAKTDDWQYSPDHRAGIERSKKYVEGSDKDFLAGFFVMSINEWKVSQPHANPYPSPNPDPNPDPNPNPNPYPNPNPDPSPDPDPDPDPYPSPQARPQPYP